MKCFRDELQSALHDSSDAKGVEAFRDLFIPVLLGVISTLGI